MTLDPTYGEEDPYAEWARGGISPPGLTDGGISPPGLTEGAIAPPGLADGGISTPGLADGSAPQQPEPVPIDPYTAAFAPPAQPAQDTAGQPSDPYAEANQSPPDASEDAYQRFVAPPTVDQQLDQQLAYLGTGPNVEPPANPEQRQQMIDAMSPEDRARAVNAMSQDEYTKYKADRQGALIAKQAELDHKANVDNERRAREDLNDQRAATAKSDADTKQLVADANTLANTKINPDRYMEDRGVGGTIRDVVGVFLMGLGGNVEGGLNFLNKRIDRDIAAQSADIENGWKGISTRKGAIADELARHGDLYRAQETYRIAAYQAAINDVQTQLQLYDPAGSRAIRGRDALDQLHGAQQQALLAFNQQQRKSAIDAMKAQSEYVEKMAQARKADAETKKLLAETKKLGAGKAAKVVKFEDMPLTADQLRSMGVAVPQNVQLPTGGLSLNQAKKLAETAKSTEDWVKAGRENSPDDRNRQLGIGEIVYEDGTPVQFRNETFAGQLANTKADVDTAVGLIDEMARLRSKDGWTSDTLKSAKWQRAQGALAALLLKSKNTDQLGVLSGGDVDLEMKKLTGGVDPTGFRDPIPGLLAARGRMLDDLNSKIRAQPVTGNRKVKPYAPPDMYSLEAAEPLVQGKTSVEQGEGARRGKAGEAIQQMLYGVGNDEASVGAENTADVGPTGLPPDDDKRVLGAIKQAQSKKPGDAIQRLADAASSDREAVGNAVIARIRVESPALLDQVLARLPEEKRTALEATTSAPPPAAIGGPGFQFDSLDVGDLAAAMRGDKALLHAVIERATSGTPAEKAKAVEVLKRAHGGAK